MAIFLKKILAIFGQSNGKFLEGQIPANINFWITNKSFLTCNKDAMIKEMSTQLATHLGSVWVVRHILTALPSTSSSRWKFGIPGDKSCILIYIHKRDWYLCRVLWQSNGKHFFSKLIWRHFLIEGTSTVILKKKSL